MELKRRCLGELERANFPELASYPASLRRLLAASGKQWRCLGLPPLSAPCSDRFKCHGRRGKLGFRALAMLLRISVMYLVANLAAHCSPLTIYRKVGYGISKRLEVVKSLR